MEPCFPTSHLQNPFPPRRTRDNPFDAVAGGTQRQCERMKFEPRDCDEAIADGFRLIAANADRPGGVLNLQHNLSVMAARFQHPMRVGQVV